MSDQTVVRNHVRAGLSIVGLWTLYGVWCANQTYFEMKAMGMNHPYWRMMLWAIAIGNLWSVVTPSLLSLSRRLPFERPRLHIAIPVYLLVFAVIWLYMVASRTALTMGIHPFDPLTDQSPYLVQLRKNLTPEIPNTLFLFAVVMGIGHAIHYRRIAREKAVRAAQLEVLLAKAQVLSLKMQLHPHFLFNTLNGVVALVREKDNEGAVKMLLGLSNMLRYALDSSGRQEVPLSEEIDFLNLYVGIEQMRFPDRLTVEMDIASDTEQALVPSLMLQPIVENAIRHGIAPRLAPGTVRVITRKVGEKLLLNVEDDGVGLPANGSESSGIGLQNTRSRLAQLYQSACDLQVRSRAKGGVEVSITLPYRTVAAEPLMST